MQRNRGALSALMGIAGFLLAGGAFAAALAETQARCTAFATRAVAQFQIMTSRTECRVPPDLRWQPVFQNHFNGCMLLPKTFVDNEERIRLDHLRACGATIPDNAAGPDASAPTPPPAVTAPPPATVTRASSMTPAHTPAATVAPPAAPAPTSPGGQASASVFRMGLSWGRRGATPADRSGTPAGIAIDAIGNLYAADPEYGCVRKRSATTGEVTDVVGFCWPRNTDAVNLDGYTGDGGPAIDARLYYPRSVVVDAAGNLLVADTMNGRIRRVDAITGLMSARPIRKRSTTALRSKPDSARFSAWHSTGPGTSS